MLGHSAAILPNMWRSRTQIYSRTKPLVADGVSESWTLTATRWVCVLPKKERTQQQWSQRWEEITHFFLFRQNVTITLGDTAFKYNGLIYLPVDPAFVPDPPWHNLTGVPVKAAPEESFV